MIIYEVQFHYVKSQCLVRYDCNHDYCVLFFPEDMYTFLTLCSGAIFGTRV